MKFTFFWFLNQKNIDIELTNEAKQKNTEWSCVYKLDEFAFDICLDGNYDKKYTFTREDFE